MAKWVTYAVVAGAVLFGAAYFAVGSFKARVDSVLSPPPKTKSGTTTGTPTPSPPATSTGTPTATSSTANIAASGITSSDLATMQAQASTPVFYPGTSIVQNVSSGTQNDAFLAGVPGATGTVETSPGNYTQYTIPTYPPAGTVLGGGSIPASLTKSGQTWVYQFVANGSGGQTTVTISGAP